MFQRFVSWPWPQPVDLVPLPVDAPGPLALGGFMPIRCLSDPAANSARNVTASTSEVLQAELRSAAAGVQGGPVLAGFDVIVRCQVRLTGPELEVCSAWLEARLIVLVRLLDTMRPRPIRAATGLWAIGLVAPQAQLLCRAMEEFRERVARDVPHQRWDGFIDVAVEDPESFKRAKESRQETCSHASAGA